MHGQFRKWKLDGIRLNLPVKCRQVNVVLAQRHQGQEQSLSVHRIEVEAVKGPGRGWRQRLGPGADVGRGRGLRLPPQPLPDDGLHTVLEVILPDPLDHRVHQRMDHALVRLKSEVMRL